MKFASQRAIAGALLFGACAEPVAIEDDVQVVPQDAGISFGGTGGIGGIGMGGSGGGGGGSPQGGAGGGTGGTGFNQGGAGGSVGTGGSGGMGGSMMAMGGAAGTGMGGTGGTVDPGPADNCADPTAVAPIDVDVFYTENGSAQQMQMTLAIANAGGTVYPTSDLTVRYWFTPGTTAAFQGQVYYAGLPGGADITTLVTITFGTTPVSAYAEIGFNRADPIGTGIQQVNFVLFGMGNPVLTQTDDFSYVDGAINVSNPNISAYVDGVLVFGCEPPPL